MLKGLLPVCRKVNTWGLGTGGLLRRLGRAHLLRISCQHLKVDHADGGSRRILLRFGGSLDPIIIAPRRSMYPIIGFLGNTNFDIGFG